jgi:aldehyde:ferredoxin oxidoreductase
MRLNSEAEASNLENKLYGWTGKILRVDLTSGKMDTESTRKYAPKFLGANGINAWITYSETQRETNPLGPENKIVFGAGPLVGTPVPAACRLTITSINPFTGGHGDSNSGGHFASELKFAGYDHIIIEGSSSEPVYLWIDDGKAELRKARTLWGATTHVADDMIKEDVGDPDIQTACIGPAGERLVMFGNVMCTHGTRASGRCGMGAIMGSKRLKAVAVRGASPVDVAKPEMLMELVDRLHQVLNEDPNMRTFGEKGIAAVNMSTNELGNISIKNWQGCYFDRMAKLSADAYAKYYKRHIACASCPVHCDKYVRIGEGEPYAGRWHYAIQSTPAYDFAKLCIDDINATIQGHWLANAYGIDIHGWVNSVQWAIECYERRILTREDTDGLQLRWDDSVLALELLRRTAYREGKLGDLLAQGVAMASRKTGRGSEKYAMIIKNQELSDEVRVNKGWGFGVIVSTRAPMHLQGATGCEIFGLSSQDAERIYGTAQAIDPENYDDKPKIVVNLEHERVLQDSLGICAFVGSWGSPPLALRYSINEYALLMAAATGWELTAEDMVRIAERIFNVYKALNVRAGLGRESDYPPERMFEPIAVGPHEGKRLNREKFDQTLDKYYALHKWDPKTGVPTDRTLEDLDLGEVAQDLKRIGKLT